MRIFFSLFDFTFSNLKSTKRKSFKTKSNMYNTKNITFETVSEILNVKEKNSKTACKFKPIYSLRMEI